jgi:hypothetical protein
MYNFEEWEPFEEMHERMRREAADNRIVVVTARPDNVHVRHAVDSFIEMYDLPVSDVYYTDDGPKEYVLEYLGAVKHYDDRRGMRVPDGCELVYVDPKTKRVYEQSEYVGDYKTDGFVLMYGPELPDGERRLYAAQIKRVLSYGRKRKDGDAEAARMVLLQDDTYRVQMQDGRLSLVKVSNGDKAAGIQGRRVVLNNDKAPLHWLTTKHTYVGSLLSKVGVEMRNIAGIRWYN